MGSKPRSKALTGWEPGPNGEPPISVPKHLHKRWLAAYRAGDDLARDEVETEAETYWQYHGVG